MIDKIISTFKRNQSRETVGGIWQWCLDHNSKVAMTVENLEDMVNNNLTWGIYGTGGDIDYVRKTLIKLGQAVGVCGIRNPEADNNSFPVQYKDVNHSPDLLLDDIENRIGFRIKLPKFIGGAQYLQTERGIISDRHCHYLWIMKKILDRFPDRNTAIIEVGAGLGLLGYFLDQAGYQDYTTIDLANANACQSYFLWRNLPDQMFMLSGEVKDPFDAQYKDAFKLLHVTDFINVPQGRFHLMINMDGVVEMPRFDAEKYINSDCAEYLLSVNHDQNVFRVIDICKKQLLQRQLFWTRDGYVEELYQK
jgi:hypothetical protein